MKPNKLFSTIAICITFCIAFTSCKKDNATVVPACKITTVNSSTPVGGVYSTTVIAYNEDGTTNSITAGTTVTTFTYSGNTIIENTTVAGAFSSKQTITQNAAGMATNIHTETNASGTVWSNQAVEYNGTELAKSTTTNSSSPSSSVTTCSWSGGNLISITVGGSTSTLDYYTDKISIPGDYFQMTNLTSGVTLYKCKNMLKSLTPAGSMANVLAYDFSADGKVSKINISVGGVVGAIYDYQYTCK